MVLKWRRAFCTSIPKDEDWDSPIIKGKSELSPSLRLGSRFRGFFSNPSTPRMTQSKTPVLSSASLRCRSADAVPESASVNVSNSAPQSPKLRCKTRESPKFVNRSTPESPRLSPLLKLGSRSFKSRCGICAQMVKSGQGTAIFTAECGHTFHFPCIAAHVKKHRTLTCPVGSTTCKEMNILQYDEQNRAEVVARDFNSKNDVRCVLKVYNDDEPLSSPTCGARFNPIPESDELEDENDEFPGFFASGELIPAEVKRGNLEISLSPEVAMVSASKSNATVAVVLKIKAPAAPARRAPIDLVTVLNVSRSITGEKLHLMKKAMRMVVSSLSDADRLSIVAFSTVSKRLLPLRRMNAAGKKSARRIIDEVVALDTAATCANDSLKKAGKVIFDRREKNSTAAIILVSDGHRNDTVVSSTALSEAAIPLHTVNLGACINAPHENTMKCITSLLTIVIQDLNIQLQFPSSASPAEVSAIYSCKSKPAFLGSGSTWCRIGHLHSEEEREFLIELKYPPSSRRLLSICYSFKDPSTQQPISNHEYPPLPITDPRPAAYSTRLKCLFLTTRAVAESKRLVERDDIIGAQRMLVSTRALILQTGTQSDSGEEFIRRLEAELVKLSWKRKNEQPPPQQQQLRRNNGEAEPLTPTSAWRAAERLAKVAIMRKSLNRVSDLHGFENARF